MGGGGFRFESTCRAVNAEAGGYAVAPVRNRPLWTMREGKKACGHDKFQDRRSFELGMRVRHHGLEPRTRCLRVTPGKPGGSDGRVGVQPQLSYEAVWSRWWRSPIVRFSLSEGLRESGVDRRSKVGVHSCTESLRAHLAGTGVEVAELVPPAVATPAMVKLNPAAMPVDAYLDEVMEQLAVEPTPREILASGALPLRWAERDGTYPELLERRSQVLSTLPAR